MQEETYCTMSLYSAFLPEKHRVIHSSNLPRRLKWLIGDYISVHGEDVYIDEEENIYVETLLSTGTYFKFTLKEG